jgi:hypothetical protein
MKILLQDILDGENTDATKIAGSEVDEQAWISVDRTGKSANSTKTPFSGRTSFDLPVDLAT